MTLSRIAIHRRLGPGGWQCCRHCVRLRRGSGGATPPGLAAGIDRIFTAGGALHAALIDGVSETLRSEGARVSLGVATNDFEGGLKRRCAARVFLATSRFHRRLRFRPRRQARPGMALAFCEAVGIVRLKPPWLAMPCTTSPWAVPPGGPYGRRAVGYGHRGAIGAARGPVLDSINDMPALPTFRKPWWRPPLFRMRQTYYADTRSILRGCP